MSCPACGQKDIIEDDEGGATIKVCADCGTIVSEVQILNEQSLEGTTVSHGVGHAPGSFQKWNRNSVQEPRGKTNGRKFIERLGQVLKFQDFMITAAVNLFEKVYAEEVKHSVTETKEALCICCLYVTARQNDYALTIRDFSYFLQEKGGIHRFGLMLKLLKTKFNVSVNCLSILAEAESLLSRVGFPQPLINQIKQVLSIHDGTIGHSGKSRTLIIVVSSYYAWRASDSKNRKTSIRDFCKQYKLVYTTRLAAHKSELGKVLKKLISGLPWIVSEIKTDQDIDLYLKDLLQFRRTLLQRDLAKAKESLALREDLTVENQEIKPQDSEISPVKRPQPWKETENPEPQCKKPKYSPDAIENLENDRDIDVSEYIKTAEEIKRYQQMHQEALSVSK